MDPDAVREYGINPQHATEPSGTVRAYFTLGRMVGQYLMAGFLSGLGIGLGMLFLTGVDFPENVLASAVSFFGMGYVVYRATRYDYSWIELDGERLRARHFYTQRIIERSIDDVEDLLTLVTLGRTPAVLLTEAWLGRVRHIMIRFHNQRTPIVVSRTNPTMTNGVELIEVIIYRMSEKGRVVAEVIDFEGRPMIRRIHYQQERRN
jgi:hypothetical protein